MEKIKTFEEFVNESVKGTVKFKDLSIEDALPFFGGGFGFKLPNSDDTSTQLMFGAKHGGHSKDDCIKRLDDYKKEMIKKNKIRWYLKRIIFLFRIYNLKKYEATIQSIDDKNFLNPIESF